MERLLVEFVVRSTLIAAAIGSALWVLRIRRAAVQHAAWVCLIVTMLALPAWLAWGPKASLPVLPAQPAPLVIDAAPIPVPDAIEIPVSATLPSRLDWTSLLLPIYLLGASVLLLRLAIGTLGARRLTSGDCVAPVTVGPLRPRIILPDSAGQWTTDQLAAVLAHEREHVRRRDPLFQWLALFNRAIFWFHPVSWWLERRIAALAEEACDAAVLEQGHDAQAYSLCLLDLARTVERSGARINAVAMAMPGVYLPQRVKRIVNGVRIPRVSRIRMACAALACAIPAIAFGTATLVHSSGLVAQVRQTDPKLKFEVASVKPITLNARGGYALPRITGGPGSADPTRITYLNYDLKRLILTAFGIEPDRLSGPDWLEREMCVIEATIPPGATADQVNVMLQNLLVERFKLTLHRETKDAPLYELTLVKKGKDLRESLPSGSADLSPTRGWGGLYGLLEDKDGFLRIPENLPPIRPGAAITVHTPGTAHAVGGRQPIGALASFLSAQLHRPVLDKTGLSGNWDYNLEYSSADPGNPNDVAPGPEPEITTAIRDQLGLRLESKRGPLETVIVDHMEKTATEN